MMKTTSPHNQTKRQMQIKSVEGHLKLGPNEDDDFVSPASKGRSKPRKQRTPANKNDPKKLVKDDFVVTVQNKFGPLESDGEDPKKTAPGN